VALTVLLTQSHTGRENLFSELCEKRSKLNDIKSKETAAWQNTRSRRRSAHASEGMAIHDRCCAGRVDVAERPFLFFVARLGSPVWRDQQRGGLLLLLDSSVFHGWFLSLEEEEAEEGGDFRKGEKRVVGGGGLGTNCRFWTLDSSCVFYSSSSVEVASG
jgi:hypothetical protein